VDKGIRDSFRAEHGADLRELQGDPRPDRRFPLVTLVSAILPVSMLGDPNPDRRPFWFRDLLCGGGLFASHSVHEISKPIIKITGSRE
jgi:hypothetical protein